MADCRGLHIVITLTIALFDVPEPRGGHNDLLIFIAYHHTAVSVFLILLDASAVNNSLLLLAESNKLAPHVLH